jgi:hypothetical protein
MHLKKSSDACPEGKFANRAIRMHRAILLGQIRHVSHSARLPQRMLLLFIRNE